MNLDNETRLNAMRWELFCEALDSTHVSVVLEGHPDRINTIDGGVIVTELDEVIEHMLNKLYEDNPEGLPFRFRELAAMLDAG